MKKKNQKGFTLAELLIVVAIIAVLVAIAIPVFTKRLEASRETTDISNLRGAYAAAQVASMSRDIPGATCYYDPNDPIGLVTGSGIPLGQGTATPGGADTSSLPSVITYAETTPAAKKAIIVTISGYSNGTGDIQSIQFES